MRLNLSDNIRVKLTEHGKDIYYHQYDNTNKLLGREVCKPRYPKVDEDGYATFQLWCFMEVYGVHMGITLPNVIEPLDIVFDAPTIEPERKKGKWVLVTDSNGQHCVCDHCGEWKYHQEQKFCGECGADMREEGEQE